MPLVMSFAEDHLSMLFLVSKFCFKGAKNTLRLSTVNQCLKREIGLKEIDIEKDVKSLRVRRRERERYRANSCLHLGFRVSLCGGVRERKKERKKERERDDKNHSNSEGSFNSVLEDNFCFVCISPCLLVFLFSVHHYCLSLFLFSCTLQLNMFSLIGVRASYFNSLLPPQSTCN